MNFCRAGVKMRIVPSTETVRKAHRKILSNTWATNFQSCTTWEIEEKGDDMQYKHEVLRATMIT